MLTGLRGAKYGLQLPGGKKGSEGGPAASKPVPSKKPAIFAEESDEEDVGAEIARQAAKKRSDKELEQQHAAALKEDPNAFDYDGVYDQMKQAQARPAQQQSVQRQPRYIEGLLKKAKERERTQEMVMERKIQKEQAAEAHLYGDKEKFVTGAYKRKLAEDAKWHEEERRREELEKANEVTNKSDLSDFYRNLLSKNEAFGGGLQAAVAPKSEALPTGRDPPTLRPEANGGLAEAPKEIREEEPRETPVLQGLDERGLAREPESMPEPRSTGKAMSVGDKSRERADEHSHPLPIGDESGEAGRGAALQRSSKGDAKLQDQSKVDVVSEAKARYLARKKQKVTTD